MIFKTFLWLFSILYGFLVKGVQASYRLPGRRRSVPGRVISVGNITWGGTGKTPLVILLAKALKDEGRRVAVLVRGYGNDESVELKEALPGTPVLVGRNRVKNARRAVTEYQADFILLDDGYQHWALERHCDVVTINATNPFGNGFLLPRGILREPVPSLSRATVFVVTKASLGRHNMNLIKQKLREVNPRAPIFQADHEPVGLLDFESAEPINLGAIRGKKTACISGIEDALSFERLVLRLGADLVYAARFNDHYPFQTREIQNVFKTCRELDLGILLTTNKDRIRLMKAVPKGIPRGLRIWVLQVELHLDDEESFIRRCVDR